MTDLEGQPIPELEIPERLIEEKLKKIDHLGLIAAGNRAAFLATTDEQFETPVSDESASQRVYAEHLIRYAHVRAEAMGVELDELPADLGALTREVLVDLYSRNTSALIAALRDRSNLSRTFEIPYAGVISGFSLAEDVRAHEAEHLGMNKDRLGFFEIPQPPEVIAPYGK